jgi:hypothetical protein
LLRASGTDRKISGHDVENDIRRILTKECMMRSTKASAAVERLKKRSGNPDYSMVLRADGLFHLVLNNDDGVQEKVGEPMEQDDFVEYVNSLGPQKPKRVSKLDVEFEKQLARRKP